MYDKKFAIFLGVRYVIKVLDEPTKNHQNDSALEGAGKMPEMIGHKMCPVSSYLKYVSALHPDCEFLWQKPKTKFCDKTDGPSYAAQRIG